MRTESNSKEKSNPRCSQWILLLALLLIPVAAQAETHCPWLNVATASGVLNGPASLEVTAIADNGNACLFRYQKGTAIYSLRISVREIKDVNKSLSADKAKCTSPATSLTAIGNEAVMCAVDMGPIHWEEVIGRVREKLFVVGVRANTQLDTAMTRDLMQEKVRDVAEQVAGALF
jgi:hypothetical protein